MPPTTEERRAGKSNAENRLALREAQPIVWAALIMPRKKAGHGANGIGFVMSLMYCFHVMRASIVIAALNEGDLLWKTVKSCRETAGHLKDCEIVVADDASTD